MIQIQKLGERDTLAQTVKKNTLISEEIIAECIENNWEEEMQRRQRRRRWTRREKKQNCQRFNQPSYQTSFPLRMRKERREERMLGEEGRKKREEREGRRIVGRTETRKGHRKEGKKK